jgi:predicted nucleic acid-binding protein
MNATVFVDTNVLIYALDPTDLVNQRAAQAWRSDLWNRENGRISFQVLQEFYAKVSYKWPSARKEARDEVRDLLAWRPVSVSADILNNAWTFQDRYQLSFWDALIVAAAKSLSCRYLLTEDFHPGQNLDGLIVVSPFLSDPSSLS